MTTHPPIQPGWGLQQLSFLDKASPQFHEQFGHFLRGNVYRNVLPSLQSESLAWLVEYLDSVRPETTLLHAEFNIGAGSRRYF
jgi:hypothetical protein